MHSVAKSKTARAYVASSHKVPADRERDGLRELAAVRLDPSNRAALQKPVIRSDSPPRESDASLSRALVASDERISRRDESEVRATEDRAISALLSRTFIPVGPALPRVIAGAVASASGDRDRYTLT